MKNLSAIAVIVVLFLSSIAGGISTAHGGEESQSQSQLRREYDGQEERPHSSFSSNRQLQYDLGIRFNKFAYQGTQTQTQTQTNYAPLTASDYPIRGDTITRLKNHTNAVSVVCEGDPALIPNHRALILRYINAIGGLPSMPNSNSGSEFWLDFQEVVEMQVGRRQNMNPATILQPPNLWKSRNDIHKVAEAVHDEYPGSLQVELIQWLWSQKVPLDHAIMPFRSKSDFIGLQVSLADLNTWAIAEVAPMNFYIKWHTGRPRPEEVAYKIATGHLTDEDGVPRDVVDMIMSMNLKSPEEFTAYSEGCPRHPSWPAMHSAASSASFWLAVVLDLTDEQYCEALRVDYAVAFARSCAGVHYPSDNTAGLNLGQTLMAQRLPEYLSNKYGSDPDKVRAKVDRLRFDWRNFNSFDCTK